MAIFNIPFCEDGLHLLSHTLYRKSQEDPLELSKTTVLLTTRRACRRLQSLLLDQGACRSMILPRLIPFGDLGASELAALVEPSYFSPDEALGKVLTALRQQTAASLQDEDISTLQALALAKAFMAMEWEGSLHQIHWEEDLDALLPDELAGHRQSSLTCLKELIRSLKGALPFFPGALQAKVLQKYTDVWSQAPLSLGIETSTLNRENKESRCPVAQATPDLVANPDLAFNKGRDILKGCDIPPTYAFGLYPKSTLERNFLRALAHNASGTLLLSGLDRAIEDQAFRQLKAPHPQSGHAALLQTLDIKREDISDWPNIFQNQETHHNQKAQNESAWKSDKDQSDQNQKNRKKQRLLHKAFQPTFDEKCPSSETVGISLVSCQDQQEETRLIGLALRHLIESPDKKALFVTPDSTLGRSVMEELKRYDITPDTGSGSPFAWTEAGTFLSLTLEAMIASQKIAKLSLFKHPLYRLKQAPEVVRAQARQYEKSVLRSLSPKPLSKDLIEFLGIFDRAVAPLKQVLQNKWCSPVDLFEQHIRVVEELSKSTSGQPLIWAKELGNLAFEASSHLFQSLHYFPPIKGSEYPGLLRTLLMGKGVRASQSVHPRILILDPDQATLQKADLLILGGMTDKNWPSQRFKDPWLSPMMRQSLGLPIEQDQASLDAHLLTELVNASPEVLCTVSRRTTEGPQKTSPFMTRLETAAACEGVSLTSSLPWKEWAQSLVRVENVTPTPRPKPSPKLQDRPLHLSVTDIEILQKNPYVFYARKILKLKKMPDLQEEPGPALFGTLLHETLEAFLSQNDRSLDQLQALGQAKIAPFQGHLAARYFWQTRFEEMAVWFLKEQGTLDPGTQSFLECTGQMKRFFSYLDPSPEPPMKKPPEAPLSKIIGSGAVRKGARREGCLTLSAKADRIDRRPNGTACLIDYKSGSLPTRQDVTAGLSPQLALEALILEAGGFQTLPPMPIPDSLEYWHLKMPCKRVIYHQELGTLFEKVDRALERLITTYYEQRAPFSASYRAVQETDFNHLARTQEWLSTLT